MVQVSAPVQRGYLGALTWTGRAGLVPPALVPLLNPPNSTDKITSTMMRPMIHSTHPVSLRRCRRGLLKPPRMSPPAKSDGDGGAAIRGGTARLAWHRHSPHCPGNRG
jgi:hypothetical protein